MLRFVAAFFLSAMLLSFAAGLAFPELTDPLLDDPPNSGGTILGLLIFTLALLIAIADALWRSKGHKSASF